MDRIRQFFTLSRCLTCVSAVLLMGVVQPVRAQSMRWNQTYQDYINEYKDLAIEEMLKYGVPASITLAQGILESGAGRSDLARKGNNHFGIKCHGWQGRTIHHDDDARGECFRAYKNAFESYEDHCQFLRRQKRYDRLFQLNRNDYKGWAKGLKECGYATSPTYAQKIIGIIELYRLDELDGATRYDEYLAEHAAKDHPSQTDGSLHPIYRYNNNYYLRARKDDTLASIAREVGLSEKKLRRYNEMRGGDDLAEGDIVYLRKKQKRADQMFRDRVHVVQAGESFHSISQLYGMRLKYLYKINRLPAAYQIRTGDKLRVY